MAANFDNDEIIHLALDGFSELTNSAMTWIVWKGFFSSAAKQRWRAELTAQGDSHFSTMPFLLSYFYLQDCWLKSFKYLISHFHVLIFNTVLFMSSIFLLYHEILLFPTAVRLLGCLMEHFLTPTNYSINLLLVTEIRKSQYPINCSFLGKWRLANLSFVKIIQETHFKCIGIGERLPACASNWISYMTAVIRIHYAISTAFCNKECFDLFWSNCDELFWMLQLSIEPSFSYNAALSNALLESNF